MITQCPKCQYERQVWDNKVHDEICPSCGIVYRKWLAKQAALEVAEALEPTPIPTPSNIKSKPSGIFGFFSAGKT